ncbi:MAG: hypothetical protein COW88_03200 [Candidatus Lloydbacteria bacterium CG22_combo_CG10-13_8_21_14_all_47_15]|uniref:DUF5673 domain-containing protein n=1 Tax=Candidatus Lloydbacteria bacterium CG22_combo_CG10-13_8_21_14_all_47_15 TaxID=1974635 RepID=A0A2H0CTM8_9BACT|nr:MAG: hypothetical protein COW88_03200 [Candidatus Lloydbacteria bacterium CG22_combo_CG10-13_8_21_14_all_47_15]
MALQNTKPIAWTAPEYPYQQKKRDWYWALGIIATAIVIAAVFLKNLLFALIIAISAFSMALYAARKPRQIQFEVSERGVSIGDTRYLYQSLESFGILEKTSGPVLMLKSEKTFMPFISIPLGDTDTEDIRDFLLDYLPEETHDESLSEVLMEYLGF